MSNKDYNFFGQSPPPQAFSPQQLAEMMKLQEYNNSTPQNVASTSDSGLNPQMMASMMQGNGAPQASNGLQVGKLYNGGNPNDIPPDAMSYNMGPGPLPWLPQNKLPWSLS